MANVKLRRLLGLVLGDTKGVATLEYAVLAGFIMVAVAATLAILGTTASGLFTAASSSL